MRNDERSKDTGAPMFRLGFITLLLCAAPIWPSAQEVSQSVVAPATAPILGPETNLPLPRFVSLKASESNVRRGPSLSHRIDWVFQRRSMPLRVVAEYGHWRRVLDRDDQGGWVHYTMLSGVRTVIIENRITLYKRPDPESFEVADVHAGVIARLGECGSDWCQLTADGYRGWTSKENLWGVLPDEIKD